ncbi:hybrid sensor histidine kinase/response regulator [Butyrivibrio sp. AE2032]|uniref:hybrid sensor histidine kinase/response regulator n=1 Tax=Butyrivibrio sp. AE2032 TaxID=1458463 RepID=UPI00054D5796|nr:response regulator [Butyrivibrio sp. AE2032]
MDGIKSERLMFSIATLAAVACLLHNILEGWEFWVPWMIFAGAVVLWWLHIFQKLDRDLRITLCFVYSAFVLFYHDIHEIGHVELTLSFALFLSTVALADRLILLDLGLLEYPLVMLAQTYITVKNGTAVFNPFSIIYAAFQLLIILIFYFIARIGVHNRINERIGKEKWMEAVNANDRDMEDFLSNISHELRTPINVISGMTAIMQKNHNSKEFASIQEAGLRLAHQIEDIQDYTEIMRGEIVLDEENYMTSSLINDVVTSYNAIYLNSDLELVVDIDPQIPSILYGDFKKLHKVFRHIIDNAFKFTNEGGVYVKVFTTPQDYGVNLIIEVTDTGIGMSREDMSRISKGLYQANKKRNRSTGGIGIGLPIVYGIVHKMGGFVMINSDSGSGTKVRIAIPQTVIDPTPCLSISDDANDSYVLYFRLENYKVPEVRDFMRSMAVNLATGLKRKLYNASDKIELEQVLDDTSISVIFTGQEEYEADKDALDALSLNDYKVVVAVTPGFEATPGSKVISVPIPLYALPIVKIINGTALKEDLAESDKRLSFAGVRALVVDDEPMNIMVAEGLFKKYGMIVDSAESGKEAITKFENDGANIDVIFMDHMMPEMDGVDAMRIIRRIAARSQHNPIIIALTANALSSSREMFIKEGFDGFIAKPIDLADFEHVMKRVMPKAMIRYEGRDEA